MVRLTSIEDVIRLLQAAQSTANKKAAKVEEANKASTKKPRKASAYSKRYGAAFKRLAPKYKKKDGSWKKDGFKRCAAAARKEAKK